MFTARRRKFSKGVVSSRAGLLLSKIAVNETSRTAANHVGHLLSLFTHRNRHNSAQHSRRTKRIANVATNISPTSAHLPSNGVNVNVLFVPCGHNATLVTNAHNADRHERLPLHCRRKDVRDPRLSKKFAQEDCDKCWHIKCSYSNCT